MKKGFFDAKPSACAQEPLPPTQPHSPTPSPSVGSNANRDAADEVLSKARAAFEKGDDVAALKLVAKSLRMCDTESARAFKDHVEKFGSGSDAAKSVKRIISVAAGAHHTVLNIAHNATTDAVKRAYKSLSLQVHPDRNHSRGAEDAFKRVNEAFKVLSDPNERAAWSRKQGFGSGFGGGGSWHAEARAQAEAMARAQHEARERAQRNYEAEQWRRRQHEANLRKTREEARMRQEQAEGKTRPSWQPPPQQHATGSHGDPQTLINALARCRSEQAVEKQRHAAEVKGLRDAHEREIADMKREVACALDCEQALGEELKSRSAAHERAEKSWRQEVVMARAEGSREAAADVRMLKKYTEEIELLLSAERDAHKKELAEVRARLARSKASASAAAMAGPAAVNEEKDDAVSNAEIDEVLLETNLPTKSLGGAPAEILFRATLQPAPAAAASPARAAPKVLTSPLHDSARPSAEGTSGVHTPMTATNLISRAEAKRRILERVAGAPITTDVRAEILGSTPQQAVPVS